MMDTLLSDAHGKLKAVAQGAVYKALCQKLLVQGRSASPLRTGFSSPSRTGRPARFPAEHLANQSAHAGEVSPMR